jgi:hypothetical protein
VAVSVEIQQGMGRLKMLRGQLQQQRRRHHRLLAIHPVAKISHSYFRSSLAQNLALNGLILTADLGGWELG